MGSDGEMDREGLGLGERKREQGQKRRCRDGRDCERRCIAAMVSKDRVYSRFVLGGKWSSVGQLMRVGKLSPPHPFS